MRTKKAKRGQEFYLVVELANALRVSHMTIYRYIKRAKYELTKLAKSFGLVSENLITF